MLAPFSQMAVNVLQGKWETEKKCHLKRQKHANVKKYTKMNPVRRCRRKNPESAILHSLPIT